MFCDGNTDHLPDCDNVVDDAMTQSEWIYKKQAVP
jgi:hypothetical protein